MARLALLVLLLANAGYFAWSQGYLRDFGFAPEQPNEPQRIAQQIRPEAVVVVAQRNGDAVGPDGSAAPVLPVMPMRATTVDAANPHSSTDRSNLAPLVPPPN